MKRSIMTTVAFTFITGAIFMGCNSPAEKVENAQDNVVKANLALDKANEEYVEDIENYRKETADKILFNNQSIAEFKARIEHEKRDARYDYNKKIANLEKKNSDMQKRMNDYREEGKEKWELFKADFNRSMDEMGEELKELNQKTQKSK